MKMTTADLPPALHQCNSVWFFNLNPVVTFADGSPEGLARCECDSMALPGAPSRAALISAGMAARYSKDDEIAAMNDQVVGDGNAFAEYQAYRAAVKTQVDAAGYQADASTPSVPRSVTMRQARLALLGAGLLDQVALAIFGLPEPDKSAAQIEWEYAAVVQRASGLVPAMGAALDMTNSQLDELFIAAAAL